MKISIRATANTRIWGNQNCWSAAPGQRGGEGTECVVSLAIEGDPRHGYHLVMSPAGFFTADSWHETKEDAVQTALEIFGVQPDEWSKDSWD